MLILITGISGFLGWNLFHFLRSGHRIIGTYGNNRPDVTGAEFFPLDIRDQQAVDRTVRKISPDVIIHTAAMTSPAECMKNQDSAWEINVLGTKHIARAAQEKNSRLIFISTDRIFNGDKHDYYDETDTPAPSGHYGRTKLEGEKIVKNIVTDHIILRLPLMYGPPSPYHSSFLGFMFDGFLHHKTIELFQDQFRTPLYSDDAAKGIRYALEHPDLLGIYHLGGSERISRSCFGYRMAEIFGFDPSLIRPILMEEKSDIPPTPADVSLNSEKFFLATGFRGRNVINGLKSLKLSLLPYRNF